LDSLPGTKRTYSAWHELANQLKTAPAKGYGEYFIHRTGHSIGSSIHAYGANLDDLEIRDEREIISNTCFSLEPGIYMAEFGVRGVR
jgi:Xaa-Pro aminopeptidase